VKFPRNIISDNEQEYEMKAYSKVVIFQKQKDLCIGMLNDNQKTGDRFINR